MPENFHAPHAVDDCLDYIYPAAQADEDENDASSGASSRVPSTHVGWQGCSLHTYCALCARSLTMFSKGGFVFGIINIIGNFGTVFVDQVSAPS
jgi:hypothetical protein